MKVLSPAVTILLTSHMKPYLDDALESIEAQTRKDIQVIVADSGQWIGKKDETAQAMAGIYEKWHNHPLIEWVTTGERSEMLRGKKCPVGWVTNEVIRAGLIRGRYVCNFYDDDLYDPPFIEKMAGFLDGNPFFSAVWCSLRRLIIQSDGQTIQYTELPASRPKLPGELDCQADGAQFMFRRNVLDEIGDPWMTESAAHCYHSDGLFLEKVAKVAKKIPNIEDTLVSHRVTSLSTYTPSWV